MTFQAPVFLLGLAAVPLLLWLTALARRRSRRYVVRFPAVATLAAVAPAASRWRKVIPTALLCAALAGLVLALARPEATVAVPIEKASVVLVTDASGSMRATDVEPSRLQAARDAAGRFLDRVPKSLRVGLVGYSDAPSTVTRPTADRDAVRGALDGLVADGGTATGDALDSALDALGARAKDAKQRPPSAIVLLSDGATTNGADPVQVARTAGGAKVPVYTVALGTPDGTIQGPDGFSRPVPPDPEALREIATASGGKAFTAEDSGELDQVYEKLGSRIGTRKEKREITAGFAAAGLALLSAGVAFGLRWSGRLP